MREVEPQPVRGDERSGLADVRAELPPQRGVQEMGGRVIAPCGVADGRIDGRGHDVPFAQRSLLDAHDVESGAARRRALDVLNGGEEAVS